MFEIAAEIAVKRKDRRTYYLGCVGIRKDGALVKARNESSRVPNPSAHAEARLSTKLDHGAVVYVVRIGNNNKYAMAKPCKSCMRKLLSRKVKKIYYTTGPDSWDVM